MKSHQRKPPHGSPLELHWNSKLLRTSLSHVPSVPGLYAFGRQELFHNFEAQRVYVYIGQTKNLKIRLEEHRPNTEKNIELRRYLKEYYDEIRCWYCPLIRVPKAERIRLEQELIAYFKPEFNILGNPRSKLDYVE